MIKRSSYLQEGARFAIKFRSCAPAWRAMMTRQGTERADKDHKSIIAPRSLRATRVIFTTCDVPRAGAGWVRVGAAHLNVVGSPHIGPCAPL